MVASGLRMVEWRRSAFIGRSISWIALEFGGCVCRGGVFFLHDACVWGGRFQSLWIARDEEEIRFVGGDWD